MDLTARIYSLHPIPNYIPVAIIYDVIKEAYDRAKKHVIVKILIV